MAIFFRARVYKGFIISGPVQLKNRKPKVRQMNTDSISHLEMEISERQKQIVFARESLESANSIVLRWGKDGTIHFMNGFGLRFFGYSSEELIGQATTSQA